LAAVKATAVGPLPAGVLLVAVAGLEAVRGLLLGVPLLFVVGMTAWQVAREWASPTVVPPPPGPDGPQGVLSQAEAAERLDALISDLWGRHRWDC
jgi:hypothetical protein